MAEKIIMTPEGRATVPPELVTYYIREFAQLPEGTEEDMWQYVWDKLAEDANWDSQLINLGLKR
jgi:hypothetical protein